MPTPAPTDAPEPTRLDQSEQSATGALYRSAIGPVSAAYYYPRFMRFETLGRAEPGWNWAASLSTLNWMIFRRLWLPALLYLVLVGAALLLLAALGQLLLSDVTTRGLLLTVLVWSCVIPGLYGNAWLHAHSRKRMARALATSNTLSEACDQLLKEASSRRRLLGLALANLALGGIALLLGTALSESGRVARAPAADAPTVALSGLPDNRTTQGPLPTEASKPLADAAPAPAPIARAPAGPVVAASGPLAGRRFYINVGLFAEQGNARKAHARLREAGLAAFTQSLKTRKGQRTRLRAGPFETQQQADAAALQIRGLQLEAQVVELAHPND